ncbi:unnamed protein product [Amoebophrya sp. A25]|nr:unnamed protein product [Amoebophrya sp. A25]|eukprot:GSA25T00008203001.1
MAVEFEDIHESGYLQRSETPAKEDPDPNVISVKIILAKNEDAYPDGALMCHPTLSDKGCRWEKVGTKCGWFGSCKAMTLLFAKDKMIWTMNHAKDSLEEMSSNAENPKKATLEELHAKVKNGYPGWSSLEFQLTRACACSSIFSR